MLGQGMEDIFPLATYADTKGLLFVLFSLHEKGGDFRQFELLDLTGASSLDVLCGECLKRGYDRFPERNTCLDYTGTLKI